MSVLLCGLNDELAGAVAQRLRAQGDEVRVILSNPAGKERWRARGVYVATGDLDDEDFVWRACGGVRTVVAAAKILQPEGATALAAGARRAGVGRFVIVADGPASGRPLGDEDAEWVLLRIPKRGLLRRPSVSPAEIAAAVDAADDLAGSPRLDLDLSTPSAWSELRLESPV